MSVYRIRVAQIEELQEVEGDWQPADLVAILEKLGVDGAAALSPQEVREMCLLSLQDLDVAEAAAVVLDYKLGKTLTAGQIKNLSHDCQFDKLWEQGGDMELHRAMFSVGSLLAVVNEQTFPTPDAVRVTLDVECPDSDDADRLTSDTAPQTIVRMLASGMDGDAILNRLFEDELAKGTFPEAALIIWDLEVEHTGEHSATLKIISSGYWLDPLRETEAFDWDGQVSAE